MIFYFSGTGNSKWVAEEIAKRIDDKAYNISRISEVPEVNNEKQIGLIFPIYAWGIPEPMYMFAKKLKKSEAFTFGVCTCGADAGIALKKLSKIYRLDSSYSIIMPSNYIIGEDLEKEDIILKKLEIAKKEIEIISNEIIKRKRVYRVNEGKFKTVKSTVVNICPALTITLIDGKPTWNEKCYQCLSCINNCPQSAIQYGKKTEKRGRYNIAKYLKESN